MSYRRAAASAAEDTDIIVFGNPAPFPRTHPSAHLAALLAGLACACFGPLTGVPGAWLALVVAREIGEAPSLYTGRAFARLATAGSVVGSLVWLGFGVTLVARFSPVFGYLVVAACAVMGVGAVLTALRWARPDGDQLKRLVVASMGAGAVTMLAGAGAGAWWNHAEEQRSQKRCDELIAAGRAAVGAGDFRTAKTEFDSAEGYCRGSARIELLALAQELPAREDEYRKQEATARFQETSRGLVALLDEARKDASQRAFVSADDKLRSGLEQLDKYRPWPHIVESPEWRRSAAALNAERDRLAPAVDAAQRARVVQLLGKARSEIALRRWQPATELLDSAGTVRKQWKPLTSTVPDWQRLDAQLAKERTRIDAGERADERKRAAAAEAERRQEAAKEARRRVRCCDGTLSPGCLCNRGSYRGCCSHHDGVCGCE